MYLILINKNLVCQLIVRQMMDEFILFQIIFSLQLDLLISSFSFYQTKYI